MPAPELSRTEAAVVAYFDAAPAAPESFVRQHRSGADCYCQPLSVGQDAWQHNLGDDE